MVATRTARLADIALPDIGMPDAEPLLPPGLYAERLQRLRARDGRARLRPRRRVGGP